MGAESRFNYSAVGDAVNIAARIEFSCKEVGFDILVSESTASLLTGFALLEAGALALKGKSGEPAFLRSLATSASRRQQNLPNCRRFTRSLSRPCSSAGKQPQDRQRRKTQRRRHNGRIAGILPKISRRPNHFRAEPAADEISYAELKPSPSPHSSGANSTTCLRPSGPMVPAGWSDRQIGRPVGPVPAVMVPAVVVPSRPRCRPGHGPCHDDLAAMVMAMVVAMIVMVRLVRLIGFVRLIGLIGLIRYRACRA